MIKSVFTILFSISFLISLGQFQQFVIDADTLKSSVSFTSENYFQSNFVTGQIASDIVFSRFISEDTKEGLIHRNGTNYKALFEARQTLNFTNRVKSNLGVSLAVEDRLLGFASLYDDVVQLGVFGNRNTDKNNYDFKNSYFQVVRLQAISPSVTYQIENGNMFTAGISYLNGQRLIEVSNSNSNISTTTAGDYIEMNLNGEFSISNTSNTNFLSNNGNGFSFSFGYEKTWQKDSINTARLSISITDLGLIAYNDQSVSYPQNNTFYNYEGVQIENLTNYPSSIFQDQSPDTILDDILATHSKNSITYQLPFTIGLSYYQTITEKSSISVGMVYRNMKHYLPMGFANYEYQFAPFLSLTGNTHFLGMGNFAIGGGLKANYKGFNFSINTANLNGLVFKKSQTGLGLFSNLSYQF